MRLAMIISRLRMEEKLLIDEMKRRNIDFDIIDDDHLLMDLAHPEERWRGYDAVFCRSLSQSRVLALLAILEHWGIPVFNSLLTTATCDNKLSTTLALLHRDIPTPRTLLAFTPKMTIAGIEQLGYPAVLKPITGSWGRLMARINDVDAAEAVLEYKETFASYQKHIHYIQEYIAKPQRDIRAFVVDKQAICAIYRTSQHWITNTARGATTSNCPVTRELDTLCVGAAQAVGGGIVAVDVLEDRERGFLVNEVNATMEFRNSIEPTGVDIPARMLDYIEASVAMLREVKR